MRTVAYLGPEHTNAHLAAMRRFGRSARYVHAATVEDVFTLVERRQADCGVVPIENSLEGAVTHTLDRFIDFIETPVTIQGEIEQPIHHCLIVDRGVKLPSITQVYSHPQALAQCRRWLAQHLPRAALRETSSTADAVSHVLQDPRVRAAIGRRELASAHRLRAIPIPDDRDNKTRFLILGRGQISQRGRSKTSVLFGLKDKPGALHDALVPFKHYEINLTKIESRPSKRKAWEYVFFVDIEGHQAQPRVTQALQALRRQTSLLRILGSYPIATGKVRE